MRHKEEGNQRQTSGDGQPFVQCRHHILHAGCCLDEEAANDGGHDGHGAECQWIHHRAHACTRDQQCTQHHGGNQRDGIGFKQVSGHARAVAHVVAHVVSNHGWVTRVVFWDTGFNLAHQVSTYVSAFGENATTQAGKDGDE